MLEEMVSYEVGVEIAVCGMYTSVQADWVACCDDTG